MADSVRVKRGLKASLPKCLPLGEIAFCMDTKEMYVGRGLESDPVPVTNKLIEKTIEHLNDIIDVNSQEMNDLKEHCTGGNREQEHSHYNKSTVDKISEHNGTLMYDGKAITDIDNEIISSNTTWSSQKIEEYMLDSDTDIKWEDVFGNNLDINSTKRGHLREIEIFGDTKKYNKDSANIFNANGLFPTSENLVILDASELIVKNIQQVKSNVINLKPLTEYTIFARGTMSHESCMVLIRVFDSTGNKIMGGTGPSLNDAEKCVFTTDETGNIVLGFFSRGSVTPPGEYSVKYSDIALFEGKLADYPPDSLYYKANEIRHLGKLYVNEDKEPILDELGRKQYAITLKSYNVNKTITFRRDLPNVNLRFDVMVGSSITDNKLLLLQDSSKPSLARFRDMVRLNPGESLRAIIIKAQCNDESVQPSIYFTDESNTKIDPEKLYAPNIKEDFKQYGMSHLTITNNESSSIVIHGIGSKSGTYYISEIFKTDNLENSRNVFIQEQTILLPCQLMKYKDDSDRLYWDAFKGKYVVEKHILKHEIKPSTVQRNSASDSDSHTVFFYAHTNLNSETYETNGENEIGVSSFGKVLDNRSGVGAIEASNINEIMLKNDYTYIIVDKATCPSEEACVEYFRANDFYYCTRTDKPQIIETNILQPLLINTYKNKTHIDIIEKYLKPNVRVTVPIQTKSSTSVEDIDLSNYYTKEEVDAVASNADTVDGYHFKVLSQQEYDTLSKKELNTFYAISDAPQTELTEEQKQNINKIPQLEQKLEGITLALSGTDLQLKINGLIVSTVSLAEIIQNK